MQDLPEKNNGKLTKEIKISLSKWRGSLCPGIENPNIFLRCLLPLPYSKIHVDYFVKMAPI